MKRFIALVLSLVMALSLCVPAWGADPVTHEVADKAAFTDALDTANAGDIIKLTANINMGTDRATVAKKLTFDLGAFTITSAGASYGTVYVGTAGDLTINATTGGITNTAGNAIGNYGVVVVNGGTFTGDYALYNFCYNATTFGTATINGGTFQESSGNLAIANCGKLTVAGGDIETLDSTAELKVTAGTIETLIVKDPDYNPPVTSTTISGGTVNSIEVVDDPEGTMTEEEVKETISITGGTFAADVTAFVADNTAVAEMTDPDQNVVYIVDEAAIKAAIDDAAVGTNFVVLAGSVALSDTTLNVGDEITIEPNPVTYTVSFDKNGGSGAMSDVTKVPVGAFILPECGFTAPEGMKFKAWSVDGVGYAAGAVINVASNVTVTAVWEKTPVVEEKITDEKVTSTVTSDAMMKEASKSGTGTEVTVVEGTGSDAETTTIVFTDTDAKTVFATATPTDISTKLTAVNEPVTNDVQNEAKEQVGKDAQIATYLDINIEVHVDNEHVGNITQLPEAIKVVIPASALTFDTLKDGYTRTVHVLRFHGTQVNRLDATLEADGSVSFYSHLFSTYAVVYEDVATPTNYPIYNWPVGGTTTPDADKTITSPETFDAGVALYVGMSVAAAVGAVTLGKKRED